MRISLSVSLCGRIVGVALKVAQINAYTQMFSVDICISFLEWRVSYKMKNAALAQFLYLLPPAPVFCAVSELCVGTINNMLCSRVCADRVAAAE